ncbi:FAD-dependent oxidoreductase [Candidatus Villigracilis affinis]|uniref:NAD(P)/FAD-dependent oxidoreductase n=1 Tax=Candidatus Villigracilis affinis TaxID=3140682 RepID=UPI001D7DCA48|nr:FAD-binding oxidoreductase [Anaerolineales bacterium]
MMQTYDAIVIGAGVMGASIAFHLAERGLQTAILERKVTASGATGHSSGLVRMHYDLAAESELTFASYKNYFGNWKERVGGECGFINTGFLQVAKREHEDKLRGNVANQQKIGINTSVISAAEVKKLFPDLVTEHFDYAAYEPDSGYADATLTTNSFLDSAKRNGATLIQNCEVTAIHTTGGKVTGVSTTKGGFDAPIIINAAGPWAKHVAALAGVDVPLVTWTHDVAFLHRPPSLGKFPAVIDDVINCYFRPEGSALILAAGEDESLRGEAPDAEDQTPTPTFVDKLIDAMVQRIPKIEESGLHSIHVGRDGITPDQRSIYSAAGPDGFYLACGLSGTGFKTSPAAGASMVELILDGKPKTVDITPFRFQRFAEGKLIEGEYGYGHIWK